MRTTLILIVLIAFAGASACTSMLVGGGGTSAGRPIGQDNRSASSVARDNRITAAVRARFAADAELGNASLSIDTRQGVVTLRGTLPAFDQRDRAVRLAGDVEGVVRVQNQVRVQTR